ncbi:MAG: cytochrome c oxidase subunit II [Pseudomonadota bacterium]
MLNAKLISLAAATSLMAGFASAQEGLPSIGKPSQDGLGFQPATTELMRDIVWFDDILHIVSAAIVVFVTALLLWCIYRYSAKRNPEPATWTHNSLIEVVWTGVPVVILLVLAVISVPLLYKQMTVPESDVVIIGTGNQWYWSYEYPDEELSFDAIMLEKDELEEYGYAEDEYLFATDTAIVVPVNATVHMLVTGSDVIHAWTIPSFGVKMDAVPGRMNEFWFRPEEVGVYFGQCSELCGKDHSYMPIVVKVVSEDDYYDWLEETRDAQLGGQKTKVAAVVE